MVQSSDLLAAGTQLGDHGLDAILVDGAQRGVGDAQLHPTVFAGDPEAALVQVRQPAATGLVVGVRDVVAGLHTLSGDLTYTGHEGLRNRYLTARCPGRHRPSGALWRHAMLEGVALRGRPACVSASRRGRAERSGGLDRAAYSPGKTASCASHRDRRAMAGRQDVWNNRPLCSPALTNSRDSRWQKSRPPTTRPPARPCRS